MKDPKLHEISHLMPHIRYNLIMGTQRYRDQKRPVSTDEEAEKLRLSGQLKGFGGSRAVDIDARSLVQDTLTRTPNKSVRKQLEDIDTSAGS